MPKHLTIILIVLTSLFSFKGNTVNQNAIAVSLNNNITTQTLEKRYNIDSIKKVLKGNLEFFATHLLKGHKAVIQNYARKYQRDTCGILAIRTVL